MGKDAAADIFGWKMGLFGDSLNSTPATSAQSCPYNVNESNSNGLSHQQPAHHAPPLQELHVQQQRSVGIDSEEWRAACDDSTVLASLQRKNAARYVTLPIVGVLFSVCACWVWVWVWGGVRGGRGGRATRGMLRPVL